MRIGEKGAREGERRERGRKGRSRVFSFPSFFPATASPPPPPAFPFFFSATAAADLIEKVCFIYPQKRLNSTIEFQSSVCWSVSSVSLLK